MNVILHTLRTVGRVQYERFRPSNIPDPLFEYLVTVSERFRSSANKKARKVYEKWSETVNVQERWTPGKLRALENVCLHASNSKDQLHIIVYIFRLSEINFAGLMLNYSLSSSK